MIGEEIKCEREECGEVFLKKTHNQRYHDSECCRLETNKNIMKKYYANRDRKQGKQRWCLKCKTILSRYNDNTICNICQKNRATELNRSVSDILAGIEL